MLVTFGINPKPSKFCINTEYLSVLKSSLKRWVWPMRSLPVLWRSTMTFKKVLALAMFCLDKKKKYIPSSLCDFLIVTQCDCLYWQHLPLRGYPTYRNKRCINYQVQVLTNQETNIFNLPFQLILPWTGIPKQNKAREIPLKRNLLVLFFSK